jgi:hypothetical protein
MKEDDIGGACSMHGNIGKVYYILVGKPEEKGQFRMPKCRSEDNIRKEIGWEGVDCIYLVQDRDQRWAVVNTVMNLRIP